MTAVVVVAATWLGFFGFFGIVDCLTGRRVSVVSNIAWSGLAAIAAELIPALLTTMAPR